MLLVLLTILCIGQMIVVEIDMKTSSPGSFLFSIFNIFLTVVIILISGHTSGIFPPVS